MTHQNMTHTVLPEYCIIDMQYSATRISPDIFNALVLQRLDNYLGTTQFHLTDLHDTAVVKIAFD